MILLFLKMLSNPVSVFAYVLSVLIVHFMSCDRSGVPEH